ncbi:Prostaglandin reductase 1 [Orchesella cincta]|uniref:Prostaglandin reductase 1 n=1 Tax=Orchesella cincta TaxID=48709 RepID=A0A1D2N3A5_ORCCI|nr:Prostaglandin reductase 1 [Orchesella cincta]
MTLSLSTLSRGLRLSSPITKSPIFQVTSSYSSKVFSLPKGRPSTGVLYFSSSTVLNQDKMQARKIVITQHFQGAPKLSDFKLVEETLPALQDGEILCKAEWLTVDPYMRAASARLQAGDQMPGAQVAKVLKSRCADFPEGSQVVGNFGWRDLTVTKVPPKEKRGFDSLHAMPEMKGLPDSYALGCLGMPGNTAYFGLTRICEPKAGQTLVVSSAAGAVGSLVGQIGKIYNCQVIGYAGTDDKIQWLKSLGFDHAVNYKTTELPKTLKQYAPQGVDCYFDNVGGEFAFHVTRAMNPFGRIALCGAISSYNNDPRKPNLVPVDYVSMIYKNIRQEGFVVTRFAKDWFAGINQMRDWILEGKLKIEETKTIGFENMPQAFIELLEGKNTGKVVIQA